MRPLDRNSSQIKHQVNNLKTYFERDKPKPSSEPSTVQGSNSSTEGKVNTKKKVLTKTAKTFYQDLVIVADATQSERRRTSESQSETENNGEASPDKGKYNEGIFWRPTISNKSQK